MRNIGPFHVMEVQARARQLEALGRDIVHMEIGQPDFGAPPRAIEAAVVAMRTSALGYSDATGIVALRRAIAEHMASRYTCPVDYRDIALTPGSSGALLLLLAMLVEPGDEWLLPDPSYPCNRHFVRVFDGLPVSLPVSKETEFQPTLAQIEAAWTPCCRGVLIASPSNPTGTLMPIDELAAIARWLGVRGAFLIVDEIYQGLTYDSTPPSALSLGLDNTFVINSFSKYFCMTGWRLGWLVAPPKYRDEILRLAQNLFICPPVPSQHAALAALHPESIILLDQRREIFRQRRDYLVDALQTLGFGITSRPEGAFYVYADSTTFALDSDELVRMALEDAGVALAPGKDFGSHEASRFVRFAYTSDITRLREGIGRLQALLNGTRIPQS